MSTENTSPTDEIAQSNAYPDDPPGIDPYTHDLPTVADASERVEAFLRWYGDGRVFVETDENGPPLYARDLEALHRAVRTPPAVPAFGDADYLEPLGHVVRNISGLIDSTYPRDLDPEAWLMRRVMKVAEEVGEVTEALFGALGENPRKGRTHTMHDVRKELLDVALAALAAVCHFDDGDSLGHLDDHARFVHGRLESAISTPPGTPTGGDES